MRYSQSQLASASRLSPRKKPTQSRSAKTVETILEGAARILEQHGFEGYTTNKIAARAGVSIGSLYQYFQTRDAVTIALIARESVARAADVKAALLAPDWHRALRGMIETAVRHQLQRPQLARLLDFEESRLSQVLPSCSSTSSVHKAIVDFLKRKTDPPVKNPNLRASDLMLITRALTDAAGCRKNANPLQVRRDIERAVLGYLGIRTPVAEGQS
jgi:AcrR family transcriptional regulator